MRAFCQSLRLIGTPNRRNYLSKHAPGLAVTRETARCQWHGETMDYSMAIESMQFLDSKAQVPEAARLG